MYQIFYFSYTTDSETSSWVFDLEEVNSEIERTKAEDSDLHIWRIENQDGKEVKF